MNKMSKCTMVSLVALISACQTIPSVAVADNASAKAEAKPVESVKPAEPKAPAVEMAKAEPKVESKATAEPVSMITPMMERQQTIRATGYAVITTQSHKNPAQQRLMAIRASKLDAYRALTEQVYGQQLDATTTVAEMIVTSDTFRTRVQGIIYGAVLESITPIGDDTYETTLSLDGRVVNDLRVLYLNQLAARNR
ncbi:MAG: LPP20 family lipoprotein [Oxalobacteraceae bacterium]